jgi:pSer/pThr/pTyr-binding forkhead associated (FHA) protein
VSTPGTRTTQPLSPLFQKGAATLTLLAGKAPLGLSFSLTPGQPARVGRGDVEIPLVEDDELSPVHAVFEQRPSGLVVVDQGSVNGVYVRVRDPRPIASGDWLRVGSQYFRLENVVPQETFPTPDGTLIYTSPRRRGSFRLLQILREGYAGLSATSSTDELTIGGEGASIPFTADAHLSSQHARVVRAPDGQLFVHDLGSSNGTWLRVRNEAALADGDQVMVGNEVLRVSITR